jgi:hypothetical protein
MPNFRFILSSFAVVLMSIFLSCTEEESDFYVKVIDDKGVPLVGVKIQVYIGYDYYAYYTDNDGRALLPSYAHGERAIFRKDQFFTVTVEELISEEYVLISTPYVLMEIGEVHGTAVRFIADQIITVDWDDEYRVYTYDESGVMEEILLPFPHSPAGCRFDGDTLWFSSGDGNIYAYDLSDIFNPSLLLQLEVDDPLIAFAHKDSILAVGRNEGNSNQPIRIFSFHSDNTLIELDRIEGFIVNQMFFQSDYLVTLLFSHNFLAVFDLSDPSDIQLSHVDYFPRDPEYSFMWGDTLGLVSDWGHGWYLHGLIEFTSPFEYNSFAGMIVDGRITQMISDSLAVGIYLDDYQSLCVFEGNYYGFRAKAVLSEGYNGHNGAKPPYFIIGDKLWRLEER